MFDKKLAWTGAALALTAAVAFVLAHIPEPGDPAPLQEPVSGTEQYIPKTGTEESSREVQEYAYLIKEYNGRVAVFVPGSDEPQMTFDMQVKFLPDYDRIQMKNGIPVKDFEALSSVIEDYIS